MAKTLSMDLRANDPAWLQLKLDALATVTEERAFEMPFPPHLARLIIHRYAMLGVLDEEGFPLRDMGVLESSSDPAERGRVL